MTKVTYQGIVGCFSHTVCERVFPQASLRGCLSFGDAMQSVSAGEADIAVIPVENSVAGRVMEVYNMLPESDLFVIGEFFMPIHHCLMMPTKFIRGLPPQNLNEDELLDWKRRKPSDVELKEARSRISEVRSHSQGLAQCQKYLMQNLPNARLRETWDTAGAARDLAQNPVAGVAVLAPKEAVRYGMTVLEENVEDTKNNTTRFLFLRKQPLTEEDVPGQALTTLVFQTKNVTGALVEVLTVFRKYGINMTKLETYMTGSHHEQPVFYVDLEMNRFTKEGKQALDEVCAVSTNVQVLGTYPVSSSRSEALAFPV